MKRYLGVVFLVFGLSAPAFATRNDAANSARNLRQDLTQLAASTRNVAQNAASNGNTVRAQRFRTVAQEANALSQDVLQYVVRPLQQGYSQAQIRNSFRYVNIQRLNQAIASINQIPARVSQDIQNVRMGYRQLQQAVNQNWGGGGGSGGGGGGGQGQWISDCRVVLETVWGSDIRDFYGRARGITQQRAVSAAREDGMRQCSYARQGLLTRCVVDNSNCGATRIW